jgi:hypothetical protein
VNGNRSTCRIAAFTEAKLVGTEELCQCFSEMIKDVSFKNFGNYWEKRDGPEIF